MHKECKGDLLHRWQGSQQPVTWCHPDSRKVETVMLERVIRTGRNPEHRYIK